MKVLIVGALGNMGRRYQTILRYLGAEPICVDLGSDLKAALHDNPLTHVIVATPTPDHAQSITEINRYAKWPTSILCEKPLCFSADLARDLFIQTDRSGNRLYCVNQYAYLPEARLFRKSIGDTYYNYFQHGKDGLKWDCFQIHALTRRPAELDDDSPKWICRINGVGIDLRNMDKSYVYMISDFLGPQKELWGRDIVVQTTETIAGMA